MGPGHGDAFLVSLPLLLQYEGWYEHSPSALLPFFALYARLSKHQLSFSLLPHLPRLFSTYLQLLELDVGGQQSANHTRTVQAYPWLNDHSQSQPARRPQPVAGHHRRVPPPPPRAQRALRAVPPRTVPAHHRHLHAPVQPGPLVQASVRLPRCPRHSVRQAARQGEPAGRRGTAKEQFLAADNNDFVSVLLPVALQALFSKSHSMVSAAESWLKHTAYWHPSLVLPALLEHVYPALDDLSSPHRMLSVMQSLSTIAPVLFHRHYYPQGAAHLGPFTCTASSSSHFSHMSSAPRSHAPPSSCSLCVQYDSQESKPLGAAHLAPDRD